MDTTEVIAGKTYAASDVPGDVTLKQLQQVGTDYIDAVRRQDYDKQYELKMIHTRLASSIPGVVSRLEIDRSIVKRRDPEYASSIATMTPDGLKELATAYNGGINPESDKRSPLYWMLSNDLERDQAIKIASVAADPLNASDENKAFARAYQVSALEHERDTRQAISGISGAYVAPLNARLRSIEGMAKAIDPRISTGNRYDIATSLLRLSDGSGQTGDQLTKLFGALVNTPLNNSQASLQGGKPDYDTLATESALALNHMQERMAGMPKATRGAFIGFIAGTVPQLRGDLQIRKPSDIGDLVDNMSTWYINNGKAIRDFQNAMVSDGLLQDTPEFRDRMTSDILTLAASQEGIIALSPAQRKNMTASADNFLTNALKATAGWQGMMKSGDPSLGSTLDNYNYAVGATGASTPDDQLELQKAVTARGEVYQEVSKAFRLSASVEPQAVAAATATAKKVIDSMYVDSDLPAPAKARKIAEAIRVLGQSNPDKKAYYDKVAGEYDTKATELSGQGGPSAALDPEAERIKLATGTGMGLDEAAAVELFDARFKRDVSITGLGEGGLSYVGRAITDKSQPVAWASEAKIRVGGTDIPLLQVMTVSEIRNAIDALEVSGVTPEMTQGERWRTGAAAKVSGEAQAELAVEQLARKKLLMTGAVSFNGSAVQVDAKQVTNYAKARSAGSSSIKMPSIDGVTYDLSNRATVAALAGDAMSSRETGDSRTGMQQLYRNADRWYQSLADSRATAEKIAIKNHRDPKRAGADYFFGTTDADTEKRLVTASKLLNLISGEASNNKAQLQYQAAIYSADKRLEGVKSQNDTRLQVAEMGNEIKRAALAQGLTEHAADTVVKLVRADAAGSKDLGTFDIKSSFRTAVESVSQLTGGVKPAAAASPQPPITN